MQTNFRNNPSTMLGATKTIINSFDRTSFNTKAVLTALKSKYPKTLITRNMCETALNTLVEKSHLKTTNRGYSKKITANNYHFSKSLKRSVLLTDLNRVHLINICKNELKNWSNKGTFSQFSKTNKYFNELLRRENNG